MDTLHLGQSDDAVVLSWHSGRVFMIRMPDRKEIRPYSRKKRLITRDLIKSQDHPDIPEKISLVDRLDIDRGVVEIATPEYPLTVSSAGIVPIIQDPEKGDYLLLIQKANTNEIGPIVGRSNSFMEVYDPIQTMVRKNLEDALMFYKGEVLVPKIDSKVVYSHTELAKDLAEQIPLNYRGIKQIDVGNFLNPDQVMIGKKDPIDCTAVWRPDKSTVDIIRLVIFNGISLEDLQIYDTSTGPNNSKLYRDHILVPIETAKGEMSKPCLVYNSIFDNSIYAKPLSNFELDKSASEIIGRVFGYYKEPILAYSD